jgi:hypothetical protein
MLIDYYASITDRHIFAAPASMEELLAEGKIILEDGMAKGIHGWAHDALVALLHNHGVPAYREEFKSMHFDPVAGAIAESSETLVNPFSPSLYVESFLQAGIDKLIQSLDKGNPVIVSGIVNWTEKDRPHMMVLTGYETEEIAGEEGTQPKTIVTGFYYHNSLFDYEVAPPEAKEKEVLENAFITIVDFKENWRKMAIFGY